MNQLFRRTEIYEPCLGGLGYMNLVQEDGDI